MDREKRLLDEMKIIEEDQQQQGEEEFMREISLEKSDRYKDHDSGSESTDYNKIEVPDGGYGWVVCGCQFALNFCTWGSNAGYAVYLAHYLSNDTFKGGTKEGYAAIGGLAFGSGFLFAFFVNYFMIKTSARVSIAVGITLQGSAMLLAAFSTKLWQIFMTQGVMASFGMAFTSIPATVIVAPWFRKKRTLALGIGAAGSGMGGVMFNLAMQKIIEVKSLRWALITQCIIYSSIGCIACLLVRTRQDVVNKSSNSAPKYFEFSLFKYLLVWYLILYVSCTMLGYVVFLYSLSDFTVSLGYSASQGSIVSCMISLGGFVGRPIVGQVADMFGPVTVGIVVHLIVGILSYAMWIPCRNFATAVAFALLTGALMGSIWPLLTSISTRVAGLHRLAPMYSIMWFFIGACSIISPIIGLRLRGNEATEGNAYVNTAIFSGSGYIGAALFLWLIRSYLVVRDQMALRAKSGDDDGELHLHVSFIDSLKGSMIWRNLPRKV